MGSIAELTLTPLMPFGAILRGVDIGSRSLELAETEQIQSYLDEFHVLVFRGHESPTDAEYIQFISNFGDVPVNDVVPEQVRAGYPEIIVVSNIVENGKRIGTGQAARRLDWHTDYCWQERVSKVGALEAVELPNSAGGETCFANMYAVYEAVDSELRNRLLTLSALHVRDSVAVHDVDIQALRQAEHPMIVTHPRTGQKAIYVNRFFTKKIPALTEDESQSLLDSLFSLMSESRFIYEHHWELGDIVLWDQLGLVHSRKPYDESERRYMRQITALIGECETLSMSR